MGEKTIEARPVEPVVATIIGTGDGSRLPSGTVASTPGKHMPDVIVKSVPPVIAIVVRFAYAFGGQLLGLLTAAMTPEGGRLLYTGDFGQLLLTCASLSLPWAILDFIKNVVTIFKELETKYPLLTGKI